MGETAIEIGGLGSQTQDLPRKMEALSMSLPDPANGATRQGLPETSSNLTRADLTEADLANYGNAMARGTQALLPYAPVPIKFPFETQKAEPAEEFTLLQKWEGTVLRCSSNEFTAVLREKGAPDEEATFDIEEVPPADRELIAPGAIFHWSLGYRDRRGQRTRESLIRFRRLPAWSKREIERARQEADETFAALR